MAQKKNEFLNQHSEMVEELRGQLKEKDRILTNYRKEHGKLQVFFDDVLSAIDPITPLPIFFKPGKPVSSPIIPVKQITDSHMGEVQEPDEIEGFNEVNPVITHNRNIKFTRDYLDWVILHRKSYTINECAVLMTGDLISGDIHDELRRTNAFPAPVQVVESARSHAMQLALLAPHFERITVHFITEDNHGRLTQKPQAKEAGKNNFNYLTGHLISSYISKHSNIEFNIYPMLEKVVNVNNRRYLIAHGHNVRGWMGIPWYGIERKVGKEAQARMQLIMDEVEKAKTIGFDKYIFGHFHTPFNSSLYSCGGSVSGTNAYDHQAGRFAYPSQSAWMVHPKNGEFNRIDFRL